MSPLAIDEDVLEHAYISFKLHALPLSVRIEIGRAQRPGSRRTPDVGQQGHQRGYPIPFGLLAALEHPAQLSQSKVVRFDTNGTGQAID